MAINRIKQLLHAIFDAKEKSAEETPVFSKAEPAPSPESVPKEEPAPKAAAAENTAAAEAPADPPPKSQMRMADGYCIGYEQTSNGYGYYRDANIGLYHDGKLIRRITDIRGYFLDFPGVEHGSWERDLSLPFAPRVDFTVSISNFKEDGLANFLWTVQPDGRYWEDEDGFGTERDVEIELCAKLNKEGVFVTPFRQK